MGQLSPTNLMSAYWLPAYQKTVLRVNAYAEIWSGFSPHANTPTKLLGPIQVVGGSVTIDRNSSVRRTASNVTLLLDSAGLLLPIAGGTTGLFAPWGAELRLYKGCLNTAGVYEYAKLGVFLIGDVDVHESNGAVTLVGTMNDRSEWLAKVGFSDNATYGAAAYASGTISDIITYEFNDIMGVILPSNFTSTNALTYYSGPAHYAAGDDVLNAIDTTASSAGEIGRAHV